MPVRQYRCTKGFSWPSREEIRTRIAAGDHMPMEERGPWDRRRVGDVMVKRDLPLTVFDNAVRHGAIVQHAEPEPE